MIREKNHNLRAAEKHPPSREKMMPLLASHNRAADLTSVSSTVLQIERRAADDLEHVGCGGLLLQRLGQVARASLYFVEQPRILDSDHRLVGKGGHQLYLLFGERLNNGSGDDNDPTGLPSRKRGTPRTVR